MPSTKPAKQFALVDCDNFYVSCERVFQPRLRNRPVVVLSNNDGVIVSRSKEVKALGIKMARPFHEFKDLLLQHGTAIFSSNYTLYDSISNRVMNTLREIAPEVDVYSIDEAFVTLPPGDGSELGTMIREKVLRGTGIPVTVGIGPTKTLAKVAAERAKKEEGYHHVLDLTTHPDPDSVLAALHVQDVWGIGIKIADWLYSRHINTALDLKHIRDELMRKRAGVTGLRVVYELRGIPCVELRPLSAPRKGIISSRSFGRYVTAFEDLKQSVSTHATIAAEKLRADGTVAGALSSYITTNVYAKTPQYSGSARIDVHPATNATCALVGLAIKALEKIYRSGFRYIKAGVMLDKISPADARQIDIFAPRNISHEEQLYRAVDQVNKSYGSGTIRPLSCGVQPTWKMKQDYNSDRYTTNWHELPQVSTEDHPHSR